MSASFGQGSPLEQIVGELRRELDGMRASAQLRSVIEQAKGVLIAREGITADAAFAWLRRVSQEHNVRVVEVAASIVAMASPQHQGSEPAGAGSLAAGVMPVSRAASRQWKALAAQIHDDVAVTVLDAVAGSTRQGDQAARLLADVLSEEGLGVLGMYRVAAGGALHLVGQVGLPCDVAAAWAAIPPTLGVPVTDTVAHDRAWFWDTRAQRDQEFPLVAGVPVSFQASATIPIHDLASGQVIGAVALAWDSAHTFTTEERDHLVRIADKFSGLMLPNLEARVPELAWLASLQALQLDDWPILEVAPPAQPGPPAQPDPPVLRVRDTSAEVPDAACWAGRCLLELWPDLAGDGIWDSLTAVARDGGVCAYRVTAPTSAPWGTPGSQVRALRIGRYLVLVWREGSRRQALDGSPQPLPAAASLDETPTSEGPHIDILPATSGAGALPSSARRTRRRVAQINGPSAAPQSEGAATPG